MVKLKDIADHTGLSINTVSRALRDSGYVSAQARDAVLKAAQELGYKPNMAARSLRNQRSYEIAVVNFVIHERLYCDTLSMEKVAGVQKFLSATDYEMTLHYMNIGPKHEEKSRRSFSALLRRKPAGIICVAGGEKSTSWLLAEASEQNIPLIVISGGHGMGCDSIYIDREQGVFDAVKFLFDKGKRNIVLAGVTTCSGRIEGYEFGVQKYGLQNLFFNVKAYWHASIDKMFYIGKSCVKDLLKKYPEVDAVIAYSDYLAAGLVAGFQVVGRKVPDDIAVVGFDNRELCLFTDPPLTTIAQPNAEVGEAAASKLLDKINNKISENNDVKVPMRIIVRESA
ncbi:MAG: LacI family transcriptional regulator [Lentisphaerae bacterium]|nr:LacI family transcriptional regulator [Lentisphaerota bacterium]MCP4101456.1 LacI family transcriptional regulator [Lentisphaerota bacterium]